MTCFYIIGSTIQSIVDNNKVELLTIVFIKTLKTKNQIREKQEVLIDQTVTTETKINCKINYHIN